MTARLPGAYGVLLLLLLGCQTQGNEGECKKDAPEAAEPDRACLAKAAAEQRQSGPCLRLVPLDERAECLAKAAEKSGEAELCGSIRLPKLHDECLTKAATAGGDVKLCSGIKNAVRRSDCATAVALEPSAGAAACTAIDNPARRDACYERLATREHAPADVCERVSGSKTLCYAKLAEYKDPALCERVGSGPTSSARRVCYRLALNAPRAPGTDVCAGIPDGPDKQACVGIRARADRDPTRCENLTIDEQADACWEGVAYAAGESCFKIKDEGRKRYCAWNNWTRVQDQAICELVPEPRARQKCLDRAAVAEPGKASATPPRKRP